MLYKELQNNYSGKTWSCGIYTIPNDLYYSQLNNNIFYNEYQNDFFLNDEIITNNNVKKATFTNLLTPNWEKHINNYVRHKFSGYRKKVRNFLTKNLEK